jgi:hypothetical protein
LRSSLIVDKQHKLAGTQALLTIMLASIVLVAPTLTLAQQNSTNLEVRVTTPSELKDALAKQVAHIMIANHMDLSSFTVKNESGKAHYVSTSSKSLRPGTRSIRVLLFLSRGPSCSDLSTLPTQNRALIK